MDPAARQERARRVNAAWTAPLVYGAVRGIVRILLWPYFRTRTVGRQHIPADGPVILAPVHRSNLDSLMLSPLMRRRLRALAKESLFKVRPLAWVIASLGAFPVHRETADRERAMPWRAAHGIGPREVSSVYEPVGDGLVQDLEAPLADGEETGDLSLQSRHARPACGAASALGVSWAARIARVSGASWSDSIHVKIGTSWPKGSAQRKTASCPAGRLLPAYVAANMNA